jgi:hypothetical protein
MNWDEFFKSDEFRTYRKRLIEQVGMYVERQMKSMIAGVESAQLADKMTGAMEMANLLVNLPETLTKSDELKDVLRIQKKEDYAALAKFLVMRQMQ